MFYQFNLPSMNALYWFQLQNLITRFQLMYYTWRQDWCNVTNNIVSDISSIASREYHTLSHVCPLRFDLWVFLDVIVIFWSRTCFRVILALSFVRMFLHARLYSVALLICFARIMFNKTWHRLWNYHLASKILPRLQFTVNYLVSSLTAVLTAYCFVFLR